MGSGRWGSQFEPPVRRTTPFKFGARQAKDTRLQGKKLGAHLVYPDFTKRGIS